VNRGVHDSMPRNSPARRRGRGSRSLTVICHASPARCVSTVVTADEVAETTRALCDRVGILREGRLVEEGTLEELRHLSRHYVEATFSGPPPSLELPPASPLESTGPTVVELEGATCWVPPGWVGVRDGRSSTLRLTKLSRHRADSVK